MKHILPTETINKVLNFLATRPYSEVANLISEIKSSAQEHKENEAPPRSPDACDGQCV